MGRAGQPGVVAEPIVRRAAAVRGRRAGFAGGPPQLGGKASRSLRHPDRRLRCRVCRAQGEGNAVFNLGSLTEGHTIKDGRIVESNFHDFRLPGMAQMPKVEVVLVPTGGFWGGHGEPGALCVVPAVLNAVFAATGKRVRTLPLKDNDVRKS